MSHRALPLTLGILLLGACSAPTIARAQVTETSVTLAWTAPGDDSLSGQPTRYDLRRSFTPIATIADFDAATPVPGVPTPSVAGSAESVTVTGLTPSTTYWFALRTVDEAGNWSDLSNVISVTTLVSSDTQRPAEVALALVGTTSSSVTVSWNDVGDDSLTGTASALEVRWATSAITEANWASATLAPSVPVPGPAGTAHQLQITGLDRTRDLWFAARATDDVNQVSAITSSLSVPHMLDTAPPATPSGLAATVQPVRDVHLTWAANSEPDLAGYHVYRAPSATATLVRLTSSAVVTNSYVDPSAPDSASLWYAVSAVDATGNESGRSARVHVFLAAAGITAWDVLAPYPNPSPLAGPVNIPLAIPPAGPYDASVEIQDSAGQHVQTLEIRNAAPGPFVVQWDGRNAAGRATAPGLYRAWLRVGDVRKLVRILRTP